MNCVIAASAIRASDTPSTRVSCSIAASPNIAEPVAKFRKLSTSTSVYAG